MKDNLLRVPVVCPECGHESLTEFLTAAVAAALADDCVIRLYAGCHDVTWQAGSLEREQLREYLEAVNKPGRETDQDIQGAP